MARDTVIGLVAIRNKNNKSMRGRELCTFHLTLPRAVYEQDTVTANVTLCDNLCSRMRDVGIHDKQGV